MPSPPVVNWDNPPGKSPGDLVPVGGVMMVVVVGREVLAMMEVGSYKAWLLRNVPMGLGWCVRLIGEDSGCALIGQ